MNCSFFITVLETVYLNIHTYYESYLPMQESVLAENINDLKVIIEAVEAKDPVKAHATGRASMSVNSRLI